MFQAAKEKIIWAMRLVKKRKKMILAGLRELYEFRVRKSFKYVFPNF